MYNRLCFKFYNKRFLNNLITKRQLSIYNNELQSKLKSGKLTYYDVLQVPRDADKNTIKEAYLKLVKEYHPDRSKSPDTRSVFICIKESHDVLVDRNKRILYDQKLRQFDLHRVPFNTSRILKRPSETEDDPFLAERWERYKRYTSGERADTEDDPHTWIKMIGAVTVSCLTVTLACLISGDLIARFPKTSCVDDKYTESDVKSEKIVKAYFNPITEEWERIIEPFEAPLPEVLINHYKGKMDDIDINRVPRKKLTTLQMPLSLTVRPTVLYDRARRRPVLIEN